MTLVTTIDEHNNSAFPIMLNVQQQQQHHLHLHRHHGLHSPVQSPAPVHRSNVIVTANTGVTTTLDAKGLQSGSQSNCKRSRMYNQTTPYGTVPHQPASVARRNARERNRVKQVNNGFAELRERIPQSIAQALAGNSAGGHSSSRAGSKKLSKVETLRMAVEYIRSLQRLLEEHDGTAIAGTVSSTSSASSMSSASSTCGSVTLLSEPDLGEMRLHNATDLGHQHYHHHHHHHHHQRQDASPPNYAMTACSEASSSPTPSFVSEASSGGSQGYGPASSAIYSVHEKSEYYGESITPEDEELLDAISMWQESQT